MNMQEAAVTLAFGGNVQVYENPSPIRDGRLIGWRMKRLGELGAIRPRAQGPLPGTPRRFRRWRSSLSEAQQRKTLKNDIFTSWDIDPARGALYAMLECGYGADFLDEWALTPRIDEFPLVVAGAGLHVG